MKSLLWNSASLGVEERRRRRLEALAGCKGSPLDKAAGRPEGATGQRLQTEDRVERLEAASSGLALSCVWDIADELIEGGLGGEADASLATGESLEAGGEMEVSIIKERDDNGADRRLGLVLSTTHEIPQLHVSAIRDGGLAESSLLRKGDRVLEVNGVAVHHAEEATALMMQAMR